MGERHREWTKGTHSTAAAAAAAAQKKEDLDYTLTTGRRERS